MVHPHYASLSHQQFVQARLQKQTAKTNRIAPPSPPWTLHAHQSCW